MAYYAPGTRYSNSVTYDEATDRANEFGDTIFAQKREDGTPTGRESVVVGGQLITLEVAGKVHDELVRQAAPELLKALEASAAVVEFLTGDGWARAVPKSWPLTERGHIDYQAVAAAARAAIAKARG